jgi:hypothetical protein
LRTITAIQMAGDVLMPLLLIRQETIDDAVWEKGWWDGEDFLIRSNDAAEMTRLVSAEYRTRVIVPSFATRRASMKLGNVPGVLLCDNCSSHISEEIKQLLGQHAIKLTPFPPDKSHVQSVCSDQNECSSVCSLRHSSPMRRTAIRAYISVCTVRSKRW